MSIDADFRLRQGAFANIRLASNVGAINRFVDLTQGDGPRARRRRDARAELAPTSPSTSTSRSRRSTRATRERGRRRCWPGSTPRPAGAAPTSPTPSATAPDALGETANLLAEVTADQRGAERAGRPGADGRRRARPRPRGPRRDRRAARDRAGRRRGPPGRAAPHRRRDRPRRSRRARETLDRLVAATPDLRELVAVARPAVAELAPTARGPAPGDRRAAPARPPRPGGSRRRCASSCGRCGR